MFEKKRQFSYKEQKNQRHKFLKFILVFLAFFIIYNIVTSFFLSVWMVDNDNMQPGLVAGDRLIFSSLSVNIFSGNQPVEYKRGNIVLVDMGNNRNQRVTLKIIDSIVRFFTAQRVSIFSSEGQYYIKRVIAVPGDQVFMSQYIFRVKPSEADFYLTEFELADKPYHPVIPQVPALWDETLPFSGSMDPIILGEDEYFLISDYRSNTNDSRTWGPVSASAITARAILRFWPLLKFNIM